MEHGISGEFKVRAVGLLEEARHRVRSSKDSSLFVSNSSGNTTPVE